MTDVAAPETISVRPYTDDDEPRVLDLLRQTLGEGPAGNRSAEFFTWKHLESPFGPSFMLVAEADGQIVGLRAFMRWHFRSGERILNAVRAVDTATHPNYQRRGIFSKLTNEALSSLRDSVDFVFNTPNANSLPGYLKMGWKRAGRLPVLIRPCRPMAFARGLGSIKSSLEPSRGRPDIAADTAAELFFDSDVTRLLERTDDQGDRLQTTRTVDYLKWRYAQAPHLDYRVVREFDAGRLCGLAIFRVRPRGILWESSIADMVVVPGDHRTLRRLLRRVDAAAAADHMTCLHSGQAGQSIRALRDGFLRSPGAVTVVVNPLGHEVAPDPFNRRSWALSLGDLEVF